MPDTDIYLDTSVVVSAYSSEVWTSASQAWIDASLGQRRGWVTSGWLRTEVHAAFAKKARERHITEPERRLALAGVHQLLRRMRLVSVSKDLFLDAAGFCDDERFALRGPDALHIAVCRAHQATLVTLDTTMAVAARALGVPVETP